MEEIQKTIMKQQFRFPQHISCWMKSGKKNGGKQYIDLIAPIEAQTGEVYAFTPDHKLFSHDCRHLTRAGAMYYARILPLDIIFEKGYTDAAYPQEINHENIVCGNGG